MKAELKSISNDFFDIEKYTPELKHDFFVPVLLKIGPYGEATSDYFNLNILSTGFVYKKFNDPVILRHTMILREFDYKKIKQYIEGRIDDCEGMDWIDVSNKLSRYFSWEFEDYQM